MSGCSSMETCPKCEGRMQTYCDWKPYDMSSGQCLECGFEYYTSEGQLALEEVNEIRAGCELEPLAELRKQLYPII